MSTAGITVYPVAQVARYLREALEADAVLGDIWISGELSNVSRSTAGHLYFTLKDAGGQFRCVMFKSMVSADVHVAAGAEVVAHGKLSFYEQSGNLQFKVDTLLPQGMGALHMEFQRLKAKLEGEGLFDPGRKRPLPEFPRRIAVVTSPTGAVWHDIQNIVRRRYPLVDLILAPAPVQGEGACRLIAEALQTLQLVDDLDVIILARGGGSLEELWAFNEEITARAIYASAVPVVSAVGHETDFTIADFVADRRAPTPSAAAEIVVPSRDALAAAIRACERRLQNGLVSHLRACRRDLDNGLRRLQYAAPDTDRERQRLDDLLRRSLAATMRDLSAHRAALGRCQASLASLDPLRTLERGYAIVYQSGKQVVRHTAQVAPGEAITIQVSDGAFPATAAPASDAPAAPTRHGLRPRRPVAASEQLAMFG